MLQYAKRPYVLHNLIPSKLTLSLYTRQLDPGPLPRRQSTPVRRCVSKWSVFSYLSTIIWDGHCEEKYESIVSPTITFALDKLVSSGWQLHPLEALATLSRLHSFPYFVSGSLVSAIACWATRASPDLFSVLPRTEGGILNTLLLPFTRRFFLHGVRARGDYGTDFSLLCVAPYSWLS